MTSVKDQGRRQNLDQGGSFSSSSFSLLSFPSSSSLLLLPPLHYAKIFFRGACGGSNGQHRGRGAEIVKPPDAGSAPARTNASMQCCSGTFTRGWLHPAAPLSDRALHRQLLTTSTTLPFFVRLSYSQTLHHPAVNRPDQGPLPSLLQQKQQHRTSRWQRV